MNKILKGIIVSSLVTPLSGILIFVFAWFAFHFNDSQYTLLDAFIHGLVFGSIGIFYTAIILTVYALPIFLFLRSSGWQNNATCLFFSLSPAVSAGLLIYPDPAWPAVGLGFFSLVAGCVFWHYAKHQPYSRIE